MRDADLNSGVNYSRQLMQQHQVNMHGCGVVCGLEVTNLSIGNGLEGETAVPTVTITPGTALSPNGDTILVPEVVHMKIDCVQTRSGDCLDLSTHDPQAARGYVAIRYVDEPQNPRPTLPDRCAAIPACEHARRSDSYELACFSYNPASGAPDAINQRGPFDRLINGFIPAPDEIAGLIGQLTCPAVPAVSEWLVLGAIVYDPDLDSWSVDYRERTEVLTQPRIQALLGWLLGAVMSATHPDLRFQMYRDRAQEFRWRLLFENEIIADSGEGFATRSQCLQEIELIKLTARGAIVDDLRQGGQMRVREGTYFQIYNDRHAPPEIRWRLKSYDQIIADSGEGYPADQEPRFWRDFHTVRRVAAGAKIEDYTIPSGSDRSVQEVRGIGDVYATRLRNAGVNDLVELSLVSAREVAAVLGVSLARARSFVDEAAELLIND